MLVYWCNIQVFIHLEHLVLSYLIVLAVLLLRIPIDVILFVEVWRPGLFPLSRGRNLE